MYSVSVPLMNKYIQRAGREEIAENLIRMHADRVFLWIEVYTDNRLEYEKKLATLKENCRFFKEKGFEVGAWLSGFTVDSAENFVRMTSPDGKKESALVCPSDPRFREVIGSFIQDVAKCDVDIILFEDDYRYGYLPEIGMGCSCKNHVAYMSRILGEAISAENLNEHLLSGGPNRYRSAWLEAKGHFLRLYAREMRQKLDEVAPDIRLGVCSCMSLWDFDGVSTNEISRILAGNTKPLIRLIGAPYWAVNRSWGNRLQDVIELERMERGWCDDDIEIIGEGDVFPRPRFACPSSYLEGFDTALRSDGRMSGILKYVADYTSSANYETGYVQSHVRNLPLYKEIDACFSGKTACGVRIWEHMRKYENAVIPEKVAGTTDVQDLFFSPAARMMAACSIPTTYEGMGNVGAVFGENARYIPDSALESGLILDAKAAGILMERGIDVGIASVSEVIHISEEHFLKPEEYVPASGKAHRMTLHENARVQSVFVTQNGEIPASWTYENENGQKFLCFAFDAYFTDETLYRQYARSRQLAEAMKNFFGRPLDAYCFGNPDLYILSKKGDGKLAVGLWNFFPDTVFDPVLELSKPYDNIRFINCSGKLCQNQVILKDIAPFAFAGFEVADEKSSGRSD